MENILLALLFLEFPGFNPMASDFSVSTPSMFSALKLQKIYSNRNRGLPPKRLQWLQAIIDKAAGCETLTSIFSCQLQLQIYFTTIQIPQVSSFLSHPKLNLKMDPFLEEKPNWDNPQKYFSGLPSLKPNKKIAPENQWLVQMYFLLKVHPFCRGRFTELFRYLKLRYSPI